MPNDRSIDPAALMLGALADEIADRLATRLAPQLAEIVEANGLKSALDERPRSGQSDGSVREGAKVTSPGEGLWTAGRVAAHYDVAVGFIYQHADELGCIRLGGGERPRLRFDPDVVRERWSGLGGSSQKPGPTRSRSGPRPETRRRSRPPFELLDFDREQ
jgi:hypothetical protein